MSQGASGNMALFFCVHAVEHIARIYTSWRGIKMGNQGTQCGGGAQSDHPDLDIAAWGLNAEAP
jgi:hypothetical protein